MLVDDLKGKQREVLNAVCRSDARRILVLGGPGTGKTVSALWAARTQLETPIETRVQRVLFLTFSRSAVSQITSRLPGILSSFKDRIEILTFHSLAHRLLRAFGRYAGYGAALPPVQSDARRKLLGCDRSLLQYDEFIPNFLRILEGSDRIRHLLCKRWELVICDEVQDTSEDQWRLLQILASRKLLLLGDANQMIYTFRPNVSQEQFNQIRNRVDLEIRLDSHSHRDPTGRVPALAEAIRQRQFNDKAVVNALSDGDLIVHFDTNWKTVPDLLCKVIKDERQKGSRDIGIFSHSNADVSRLAKALDSSGINTVLVGIPDAHAEALRFMMTQCAFAAGLATKSEMRESLGVFLTACKRGKAPPIARKLAGKGTLDRPWDESLQKRERELVRAAGGTIEELAEVAMSYRERSSGQDIARPWERSVAHFTRQVRPFRQLPASEENLKNLREIVERNCTEALVDFTYTERGMVKLMNFHQTKGREADSVVLVFGDDDYFGGGTEPFINESRLLNVAISRARQRVIVILPPSPHPLVRPLTTLREVIST